MSWEILLKKKGYEKRRPYIPKEKNIRNPFKGQIRSTKNPKERKKIKQSMKTCPKFPNKITYQSKREAEREAKIQSKQSRKQIYVYQCPHKVTYTSMGHTGTSKKKKKTETVVHYHLSKQPPRDKK